MKEVFKKLIFGCICLFALTANAQQSVNISGLTPVSAIQTAIQSTINTTENSGGGTVMITGTCSDAAASLALNIPSNITVIWNANYSSDPNTSIAGGMIAMAGDGNFAVASAGSVVQSGSGVAINASGANAIITINGTVSATSGSALSLTGSNSKVIVGGNGSVSNAATGGPVSSTAVISISNTNTGENVVIKGNGQVQATADGGYAILTYGNVRVEDNAIVKAANGGAAIDALGVNSTVTVNGGTVSTTGGNQGNVGGSAIRVNGSGSSVIINGGTVSATTGLAINAVSGTTVNINGGFVFAYGTGLSGVINPSSYTVSGNGVAIAWDDKNTGPFPAFYTTALTINPADASIASWRNVGGKSGIRYTNGTTDGFFPIDGIMVNLDTDYGLIFDAGNGSLYLDVRGDGNVSDDCKYIEGQNTSWTGKPGALALNGFSWISPASPALRIVNGNATITLTGDNVFQTNAGTNAFGIYSANAVTIDGSGAVTAQGTTQAVYCANLNLPAAYTYWMGANGSNATQYWFPTAAFNNSALPKYLKIQQLSAIKDIAVNVTVPVTGEAPNTTASASGTINFTIGSVTWYPSHNPFAGNTQYTATVTLTAKVGYRFATDLTSTTINGQPATVIANDGATVTLSYQFSATVAATVTSIAIVTQPTKLVYTYGDALDLAGLAVKLTYGDNSTKNVSFADFGVDNITTEPAGGTTLNLTYNEIPVKVIYENSSTIFATTNNLTVNLRTITDVAINGVIAPETSNSPDPAATTTDSGYTVGDVAWNPADNPFLGETQYTATVTLTAEAGYQFAASLASATINGKEANVATGNSETTTLSYTFQATDPKIVTDMAIKSQPTKLIYTFGDALDLTGLAATLTYNDKSTMDVYFDGFEMYNITTNPANATLLDMTHNGISVTVIYDDSPAIRIATRTLTVNPKTITDAAINVTAPITGNKPNATASGTGDFTISEVTWTPSDNPFQGSRQYAASVTLTADDAFRFATVLTSATINGQNATVTANDGTKVTLSYTFTTAAEEATSIAIKTPPAKMSYFYGEKLDLSGLVVTITYNDNSKEDVPFAEFAMKNITTDPINGTTLDLTFNETPVSVVYDNSATIKTVTDDLTVDIQPIADIAISVAAAITGDVPNTAATGTGNFSISPVTWTPSDNPFLGGKQYTASVTLTTDDGYQFATPLTSATINGKNATVTSNDGTSATLSYTFTTTTAKVTDIAILTRASKTSYSYGEAIDLSDLAVTLTYSDGSTKDVSYPDFGLYNITTDPVNGEALNSYAFYVVFYTVIYDNSPTIQATTPFPVQVNPNYINSVAINVTPPDTGGSPDVSVTTADKGYSISAVAWTPENDPFLSHTAYTITVTLSANSDSGYMFGSLTATINGQPVDEMSNTGSTVVLTYTFQPTGTNISIVSQPVKLTYTYGEVLDLTGLEINIKNNDGSVTNVPFADFAAKNIFTNPAHGSAVYVMQTGTRVTVINGENAFNTDRLTVNPKSVAVTANGGSSTYGESPANPGFFATGLVNGEKENVLTDLRNSFGITATTFPGSYELTVAGILSNPNYALSENNAGIWIVNKLPGADVSGAPTINGAATQSAITANGVTIPINPGDQTVEYAISASGNLTDADLNALVWQSGTTFSGDYPEGAVYYIYARSAENAIYTAGKAQVSTSFSIGSTGIKTVQTATLLKAYVQNDRLYVTGLSVGKPWTVYTPTGSRIYQNTALDAKADIPMKVKGVYIIQSDNRSLKVAY